MLATSMRGIHERFDRMEKAIQALLEQQKKNEKKLEELMASVKVKNPIPPTRRATVSRQSADCRPTVNRRVDNYLIL